MLRVRKGRNKARSLKGAFYIFVLLVFSYSSWLSYLQYKIWAGNELGRYFLPEYQVGYFYFYSFTLFFLPYLLSFILGALFIYLLTKLNNSRDKTLFEDEEPYIAGLFMFLSGYPGILIYFVSILAVYLLWHIVEMFRGAKDVRLPLYYLWPIAALLMILVWRSSFVRSDIWLLLKI